MIRCVGLDLSLTASGVATAEKVQTIRYQIATGASDLDRVARLRDLGRLIDRICRGADVVVMEGYAFGRTHQLPQLGELGGVVKVCLFQRRVPFVIVPPAKLKAFATGKGDASKDQVLARAARENSQVQDNNQADAFFLRGMGLAHYEQRDYVLPEYRRHALMAVKWPELEQKEAVSG